MVAVNKSGGGRVVFTFSAFCDDLWGGCPSVTGMQNSIDSSKPLLNDDSDWVSPVGSSSILDIADTKDLSNEKESNELSNEQEISNCQEENDVDADNSECDLLQPTARRRKVEEMLNERKDKKLTTKFSQEVQALHLSRDLQLMKQISQKFEESDKRLQENFNSANAIMSNIGVAIQQSVGILGRLLASRNQIPPNAMQQMYAPMNFQAPPQQPFQQDSCSSGTYYRREKRSNVTNETCFEDEKTYYQL